MVGCPPFPLCQYLGRQLLGERMRLKRLLNHFQCLDQFGFALGAPRTRQLGLPVQQRQQELCHPMGPYRRQSHVLLDIVPHLLPPKVDQGGEPGELPADFVQRLLFEGQAMRCDSRLNGGDLRVQLPFHLV